MATKLNLEDHHEKFKQEVFNKSYCEKKPIYRV